ncbi:hypothetical protein H2241_10030 [Pantoea ananatis]|uniref:hypothetical protein n=1 Tax=Pantoea ananas TaxID=553 RepID=UPI00158AB081|nr:hypothetical protein [Pantoea ananatis]MBA4821316.1 hypothetical protein [Pantoea ananatis]QKV85738.1 hypothetical protein FOB88_00655 [Pantoea ananatis]
MWKLKSVIDMQGTNPYLILVNNLGDTRLLPCKNINPAFLRTLNFSDLETSLLTERVKINNKSAK